MTSTDLRALQALILATPDCAPFVLTNEMPPVGGAEAAQKDRAIASIISAGRTRLVSYKITERGIREALSIVDGASLLKTLHDLSTAAGPPTWLSTALTIADVAAGDQWAYFDTLRCGWSWLTDDGIDIGASKARQLLDIVALGQPDLVDAVKTIKDLAVADDPVSAEAVSRALRGPWGDE